MSHQIEQPIDIVLSTLSEEWHGLATVVESIGREVLESHGLFFPIKKSQVVNWTGENSMQANLDILNEIKDSGDIDAFLSAFADFQKNLVFVDTHQTVMADLTDVRPDLVASGVETHIPLAIPKTSYNIITNEKAFSVVERVFECAKIVNAGTLKGGKVFFLSLDIGEAEKVGPRGDKFMQYLDVITSHDGTLGTRFYDSGVRIVCMNTLQASLANAGGLDMRVYHTVGADKALDQVAVNLGDIFAQRSQYFTNLEYLDSVNITEDEVKSLVASFFTSWNIQNPAEYPAEISTNVFNRCEEITHLFRKGQGNKGATLYDAFNGMTEYYTWGSGTGAKTSKPEKFLKSRDAMQTPNQFKEGFLNYLMGESSMLQEEIARGEKLVKDKKFLLDNR